MYIEAAQTREVVGEGDVGRVVLVPVTGRCSSSEKGYGFSGNLSILLPTSMPYSAGLQKRIYIQKLHKNVAKNP